MDILKILVVDDDAADRKNIIRSLSHSVIECEFIQADSVRAATELAETHLFDCAFMDYNMPGEDGIKGIRALHHSQPHLPIIMLTGQGNETIAAEALKSGAMDYLSKDRVSQASIEHAVWNALDKAAIKKKMTEQRVELERFAHVLVHDLNSPISHVSSFLDLMKKDVDKGVYDKLPELIGRALRANVSLAHLVETLAGYIRMDFEVKKSDVDLQITIQNVIELLQHPLNEAGAELAVGFLPTVKGNKELLVQLFQNLIGNAIKYRGADPLSISVTAETSDNKAVIKVTDNGIGIPAEYQRKIFEPFERLHPKNKYGGAGLGLATCQRIVEKLDGKIYCESALGSGTSFFVELPLK